MEEVSGRRSSKTKRRERESSRSMRICRPASPHARKDPSFFAESAMKGYPARSRGVASGRDRGNEPAACIFEEPLRRERPRASSSVGRHGHLRSLSFALSLSASRPIPSFTALFSPRCYPHHQGARGRRATPRPQRQQARRGGARSRQRALSPVTASTSTSASGASSTGASQAGACWTWHSCFCRVSLSALKKAQVKARAAQAKGRNCRASLFQKRREKNAIVCPPRVQRCLWVFSKAAASLSLSLHPFPSPFFGTVPSERARIGAGPRSE